MWPKEGVLKMKILKIMIAALLVVSFSSNVFAKNIRATELSNTLIAQLLTDKNKNYVVEFRSGDQIPLNFEAKGDLFDSTENINNVLNIKKDFFIKIANDTVSISLNGSNYLSLNDAISGNFSLGSDIDHSQIPEVIKVMLAVHLK